MDDEELIERVPRLFHVTEADAWPSIRRRGLLSTSALLELFGVAEPLRSQIEAQPRPRDVVLEDPHLGRVVIRDNRPLRPHILRGCLKGAVSDWCRLLNARVFFWASERRLRTHLRARGHRGQPREILVVNTRRLLARHRESISLCAFNSGSALYPNARQRGPDSFLPLDAYRFDRCRARQGASDAVAEVCVDRALTDIEAVVSTVHAIRPDGSARTIWFSDAGNQPRALSGFAWFADKGPTNQPFTSPSRALLGGFYS
jgi:hypothetical protein